MYHHPAPRLAREHIIAMEVRKLERRKAIEQAQTIDFETGDRRVRRRCADPGGGAAGRRCPGA
jgi:hypothetical protein